MTQPGTDPVRPSVETLTAQLYGTAALLFGALVRETELTAALRKIEAERDDYKRLAGLADTLARECRIHESHADAAEADNARLREVLPGLANEILHMPHAADHLGKERKLDRKAVLAIVSRAALTGKETK